MKRSDVALLAAISARNRDRVERSQIDYGPPQG